MVGDVAEEKMGEEGAKMSEKEAKMDDLCLNMGKEG